MKKIVIITTLFLISSCNISKNNVSDSCKTYLQFIEKNWIKNEDQTFAFKGNPNYWNADKYKKYVDDNCLLGKSKDYIEKIFGTPTKVFKSPDVNTIIYCLDSKICLRNTIYGGNFLRFNLSQDNEVIEVFTGPGDSDIPD